MPNQYSKEYLKELAEKFKTGYAKEHAYRPALNAFFQKVSGFNVVNDPKRSEYGSPDFVFLKGKITIAYAEAKDIGISLDETEKGEQMLRYYGYSNLILTDYLEFRFFRNGEKYCEPINIGEVKNGIISPIENNFSLVEETIKDFTQEAKEPIKSGILLAKVMAGKARRIRDNIKIFLAQDNEKDNKNLLSIYEVIKKLLIADLDLKKFADMYAQTVVYGLFAARYHDETPNDFTRQEARDLVPASNPFLREFFDHIAGSSFDKRIEFIVNELCEEFTHADVQAIVHNYYKTEKDDSRDPIIHFYEDFLQEYDSLERKKMGVFYTPLPVVRFIVRSIDTILKRDFSLKGLADQSKIEVVHKVQGKKGKQLFHKVQILDPATGTGTFLNEVIFYIKKQFIGQEGRWPQYIQEDLLPRLHGFELMMASYTIAHLKLSTTIKETGANIKENHLNIFLTNSLEKEEKPDLNLFNYHLGLEKAISEESEEANKIKNDLPIMVVLGNPPYSGVSSNETVYANSLVERYKVEPGGLKKLQERKHWLNDDYVKFIAFAESMIENNGEGIMAMITNHSYIDNPTFRGMRWHLAKTFDKIYILDLHGNSKKNEISPDGGKDENVFDIQQGVAIIIGVKTDRKKTNTLASVYHADLFGKRSYKYAALANDPTWEEVNLDKKMLYFVEKNMVGREKYDEGFSVVELFSKNTTGIVTGIDKLSIQYTKNELEKLTKSILNSENPYLEFNIKDGRKYKKEERLRELRGASEKKSEKIYYRPFDLRHIYYTEKSECWINSPRSNMMKHFIGRENIGLMLCRQQKTKGFRHVLISRGIVESSYVSNKTSEIGSVFPLYLYAEDGSRKINFKKEIFSKIEKIIGTVEPEDVLDYIYAVLHSSRYREKYKEFLKIDFPRVPYPKEKKQFFDLANLGAELRQLHLMESKILEKLITTYSVAGENKVEKVVLQGDKVYINKTQYFGGVSKEAWEFYIGGYQPAQKWLKDRKGRELTSADIEHYQKIVVALVETGRIMKEIDKIEF